MAYRYEGRGITGFDVFIWPLPIADGLDAARCDSLLARAQVVCADSNAFARHQFGYLVAVATATDLSTVAIRDSMAIPAAPQTQIALVRDASVCAQAGAAYAQAERDSILTGGRVPQLSDSTLGKAVHVYRVANRYLVSDETNVAGEFPIVWIFDQTFATPLKRLGI